MTDLSLAAIPGRSGERTATGSCTHCGLPSAGARFCCPGCAAAYQAIQTLGLGRYYARRVLDPAQRPLRPDAETRWDLERYIEAGEDGVCAIELAIDGLQCGACVWLIESVLGREPDVCRARINLTTRHLRLAWNGPAARARDLVARVEALGYRLIPFDPNLLSAAKDRTGRALLRALAVAGFAAGNVMLISIGVWAGLDQSMGPATRSLMHWISALIAMPAIAYSGMPFFRSAVAALRAGQTNMDVPISIGVVLVTTMSLIATLRGETHAYFDSAITLIFFLLIGRVLDHRARFQARATAELLLSLRSVDVAVVQPDGSTRRQRQESVQPGEVVFVATGERIGVDGAIAHGTAMLDASLVTGESLPLPAGPGDRVFAGTINMGEALLVDVQATGAATLLAECARLIEAAEATRGRYVVLADRVARLYAPTVHLAAAAAFLLWWVALGASAADSLLVAASVLIITCPCALALAVPAVQVIATSALFRRGILLKSPTGLERLAEVDTVVFDKTGTLTDPVLALAEGADPVAVHRAAPLAAVSRHPLARALVAAAGATRPAEGVSEQPGQGLVQRGPNGECRLGSAGFCAVDATGDATPELWFTEPGRPARRFAFSETLRPDAVETVARLRRIGMRLLIASGDRPAAVARIAGTLGIDEVHAGMTPVTKLDLLAALRAEGRHVLMVGDGLNDAPSLSAALVSASPATAADLSQTVADAIFQGRHLAPVATMLADARRARRIMRQNLGFAITYNALMLPLAVAGLMTPWLAAAAMSASSVAVIGNSFRTRGMRP